MAISTTQIQSIIDLKLLDIKTRQEGGDGRSNASIAEEVLGSRTAESTVRRVYKGYKDTGSYRGVKGSSVDTSENFILDEVSEETLEQAIKYGDADYANLAKRLRTAQVTNNQLRKIHRGTVDNTGVDLKKIITEAVSNVEKNTESCAIHPCKNNGQHITAEVLLSDIQYGKLMHGYNTQVAVARVKEYILEVKLKIQQLISKGFVFDKIILAMIGDLLESDRKHPNSGRACDSGTSEQMKTAIESLFCDVIEPLALLGIPIDVISITGNHDHDGHGLNMYMPGEQHLSWPLYHSLKMLTEAKGYDHVTHEIPTGCYTVKEIYGFNTLYEHGVGVSVSEAALTKRMSQRGEQVRKHISYMRMGDKHNVSRFNNDTRVINGSTFGSCDDKCGGEYSAIVGYSSEPAQLTLFHTPRQKGDDRLSICDSLLVQLGHIKGD